MELLVEYRFSPNFAMFFRKLRWILPDFNRFINKRVMSNLMTMATNEISIRTATRKAKRFSIPRWATLLLLAVMLSSVATLGFDAYSGKLGIIGQHFEIEQTAAGKIIRVPAGGNIQAAIAKANSGDIIELKAGATYYGEIKLPNKPITDFITIQSSGAVQLAEGKRVGPTQSPLMAKIVTRDAHPAVSAANGAHHFRFIGVEFAPETKTYVYNLVLFGNGEAVANLPHHLEIDRSYLHPSNLGISRRAIALNSADTVIKNSYIEGFAGPNEETQGICGWTGTRNAQILNNYIEGGAENILFGGSDPDNAELIPTDIEIKGNHLSKPEAWKTKVTVKTLFELKNSKRVKFIGNLLENNWKGSAFRITVRNQDGKAPFSTIEDVEIRDNVIRNVADGINILGQDDSQKSGTLKNLTIENNLFLDLSNGPGMDGSGYLIQVASGENILIANNTSLNTGNIVTFHGDMPTNFVFRDNIVGHGNYGIHGPIDLSSSALKGMFFGNLFMNLNSVPPGDYAFPSGNEIVKGLNDVGFANIGGGDYRLSQSSKYRGKGLGGKNAGSNLPPLAAN